MNSVKSRISDIENYKKSHDTLIERQRYVLNPIICDESKIPVIYKWIEDICNADDNIDLKSYSTRDYFIFIIVLLYSPRVFAGKVIERGKRDIIAQTLHLSPSHITNSLRNVCSWYKLYKDFQSSTEYIYGIIINRLNNLK